MECIWVNILVKYSVSILRQKGVKNLPLSLLICSKWLATCTTTTTKKPLFNLTFSDWKLHLLNLLNPLSLFQCNSCPGYRIRVSKHDFYCLSLSVCIKINTFCLNGPNLKERSVLFCMTALCSPVLTVVSVSSASFLFVSKTLICKNYWEVKYKK